MNSKKNTSIAATNSLYKKISDLITASRKLVATSINTAEVCTKYQIGQFIVEEEQKGRLRAEYGKQVLTNLSNRLMETHGSGWTVESLTLCRKFFTIYSNFVNTVYDFQQKSNWGNSVAQIRGSTKIFTFLVSLFGSNAQLVELTLPSDSNIYASAYNLYLPDKKLLQSKVKEWIQEFEDNQYTNNI